jgi:RHS repeat-associated protein
VNPSFSYDANGNMSSRAGSTVSWSSYNYPIAISANDVTGSEEVQFSYGPDRQRWKQIYTSPTPTETTYYVGGLMDVVFVSSTTNYRHYIYAGREPVAVYSRTAAGVNTMSYMLEDHQGSVSTIASKSGAVDVNESFSAFGTRRNPTTWSGAPIAGDLNTIAGLSRQGYTFQTWLGQSMGLSHMNGRVQDALLGRFLSPDPLISDPSNAQNYNRYSYVKNNPLTYSDPSGFCDDEDLVCIPPIDPGPPPQVNIPSSNSPLDSPGVGFVDCMGNCNYGGNFNFSSGQRGPNNGNAGGGGTAPGPNSNSTDGTVTVGDSTQIDPVASGTQANSLGSVQSQTSGDQLQEITVTGQGESQGQGPDISIVPSFGGITGIIVTAMRARPISIFMSTWSFSKIATQHLWFPFSNTSQFLPVYNSYTALFGLAGTIWGRGAANGYFASNGMFVAYANLGQPVGSDQSGNLTSYGTIVVLPNPDNPIQGEVISMYPGQPGNIPQY